MKKRVFIALSVGKELTVKIFNWQSQWLKSTTAKNLEDSVNTRWISAKNLHVTLIPPWYVESNETVTIKNLLREVRNISNSFELVFNKVTFAPPGKTSRLIWAEGPVSEALLTLKSRLEKGLGQKPQPRPFTLHMTLARFPPLKLKDLSLHEKVDWKEKTPGLVLMESHLSRLGADYQIL